MNRLIKERYYVLCIMKDNSTSIKSIVEMLIRKVFRIYELSALIVFDRGSQFVVII